MEYLRLTACIVSLCALAVGACSDGGAEATDASRLAAEAAPIIAEHPETGERSLVLRVMTYNIEALPWPVRKSRAAAMERIGRALEAMREAGRAPHILLLQEGFIDEVDRVISRAGLRHVARGPTLEDIPRERSPHISQRHRDDRNPLKGEGIGKWLGGGLYILSDFPILETAVWPFSRDACAGYDCAANKGVLFARISVPGLPTPLQMFTTHLNAHQDTDVPPARSRAAHKAQVAEMEEFLSARLDPNMPLIFGGDFNTKDKPERYAHLEKNPHFRVIRQICAEELNCELGLPLEGERPWLSSQDLQGFVSSPRIRIRPVDARIPLESSQGPQRLSDHDAYLVTYELRWTQPQTHAGRTEAAPAHSAGPSLGGRQ